MKKGILFIVCLTALFASCIQDEALNPEADILTLSFTDGCLRAKKAEIGNDYIVVYPKKNVDLRDSAITHIELSEGATYQRIEKPSQSDTLFFIDVTSQSQAYTKRYSVIASYFPAVFDFENWVVPTSGFLYENPKEGSLQWFSSNNGAAIAWSEFSKPKEEYLIRETSQAVSGKKAAELRTMAGPGKILELMNIPCLSGSLYLGGFDPSTGLTNPLHSTNFGVPFNDGKPLKLTGHYRYKEGEGAYINPDGSENSTKKDTCSIYAVLFKTDERVQFLYGDDIDTSPNVIARAALNPKDIKRGDEFTYFEIDFDYDAYATPFSWEALNNDEYKITIVFASSHRGQYYEGRIGSALTVDKVELVYEVEN
ncbi:MAG: PCMD domain-containing protein [Prevotellaceae bacterium]|jgi:hypothetical protein|nr:PCMD domain-containing protein [Prevotellaceae bacterium]